MQGAVARRVDSGIVRRMNRQADDPCMQVDVGEGQLDARWASAYSNKKR